jgi:hypothetical protein
VPHLHDLLINFDVGLVYARAASLSRALASHLLGKKRAVALSSSVLQHTHWNIHMWPPSDAENCTYMVVKNTLRGCLE